MDVVIYIDKRQLDISPKTVLVFQCIRPPSNVQKTTMGIPKEAALLKKRPWASKKQLPCSENDPGHPKRRWPVQKKTTMGIQKKAALSQNHPGHPKKYSPVTKTT